MIENKFKIGFSEIGGIYIGKNIQSNFHKHYAITIIISFGKPFLLSTDKQVAEKYQLAIIQKNINYNLKSSKDAYLAFIHIVPYSDNGLKLSNKNIPIESLKKEPFEAVVSELKKWFKTKDKDVQRVEYLLALVSSIPQKQDCFTVKIDERIKKSFALIMKNESEKLALKQVASQVNLSASHFARLFKKETEMTFRQFFLHSKLIKSIYAMYEENSLTEASFIGGFSDQAHFSRTFKNNFGIKPSTSLK